MNIYAIQHESRLWYRLSIYGTCTILALTVNYLLGKDMAWDTLNYQFYAGFSAVHNRFNQDYFAAGPQSYFNPYIYVPFYEMVTAGFSPFILGSIMTLLHSVILWISFEIGVLTCPSLNVCTRNIAGFCVVILTIFNPILLQQIGSSFADITTAEFALAGWLLLGLAIRNPRYWRVMFAGILLGLSSALKLTNALHAVSGFAVLLMLPVPPQEKVRYFLFYAGAGVLGFLIVAMPWAIRLLHAFGNPLFPLMNGLFRSPDFTLEPLRHFRFIPENFSEAMWRPFAMIDPINMVHEELRAPDLRYAVLVCLAGLYLAFCLIRGKTLPSRIHVASDRIFMAYGLGFLVDWALWLNSSGNSRYFLPMACVAASLIVAILVRLFHARVRMQVYTLTTIFFLQGTQLLLGADLRWNPVSWDRQWLDVRISDKLAHDPSLFLSIGVQSNSFIAPYLSRDAGLVNFSGAYPLSSQGTNGERVKGLINKYTPRLRVLLEGKHMYKNTDRLQPYPEQVDFALKRFNLRIDDSQCETIEVRGAPPDVQNNAVVSQAVDLHTVDVTYLVSCHIVSIDENRATQELSQRDADIAFDHLEDACPDLFQPRRVNTDGVRQTWMRSYINTDLIVWARDGWLKMLQPLTGDDDIKVGRIVDWINAPPALACGRRNGHYFVKLLDTKSAT